MRSNKLACAVFLVALGSAMTGSVSRADDEELPAIHTLACTVKCANWVDAVHIDRPLPPYPSALTSGFDTYVEGYVLLQYKVTADGHVSDINTLELVGPKEFAENAKRTLQDWTFKPATVDGKPVEICKTLMVTFRFPYEAPGGRDDIVHAYRAAVSDVKEQKWDDALAKVQEAQATPKLNFYERGMLAFLASQIAMQKRDYLEARRLTKLATDHGANELDPKILQSLWETRVRASLALGDIVDGLEAYDRLKRMKNFDPSSPIAKFVEEAHAKADDMPLFSTIAKIPQAGEGVESAYFGLYRRNFAFQDIKGSLSDFILSCKQQAIESKITETAEWHVPKSWSDCRVLVRGEPGTTFRLAQATE